MPVESRGAPSTSGFVQHAVSVALGDVAGWGALLADALRDTGGGIAVEECRWTEETLGRRRRTTPAA